MDFFWGCKKILRHFGLEEGISRGSEEFEKN